MFVKALPKTFYLEGIKRNVTKFPLLEWSLHTNLIIGFSYVASKQFSVKTITKCSVVDFRTNSVNRLARNYTLQQNCENQEICEERMFGVIVNHCYLTTDHFHSYSYLLNRHYNPLRVFTFSNRAYSQLQLTSPSSKPSLKKVASHHLAFTYTSFDSYLYQWMKQIYVFSPVNHNSLIHK